MVNNGHGKKGDDMFIQTRNATDTDRKSDVEALATTCRLHGQRKMVRPHEALAYQNPPLVERFAKAHKISLEMAAMIFEETKKFLIVSVVHGETFSPSPVQDEMWHHFILHTQGYTSFCERFFGRYVHHLPCDGSLTSDACKLKTVARALFGAISEECWPVPTNSTRCCAPYC